MERRLASPVMLLIALGARLSSPGPAFYRQDRVTWNDEYFRMLKYRTMSVDAEAGSGRVWAGPSERWATPFGTFLRRFSLGDLPQFFKVLLGELLGRALVLVPLCYLELGAQLVQQATQEDALDCDAGQTEVA